MNRTGRMTAQPVDLHVGQRVAERRLSLGHTQSDLAQAMGVTFQQVQKYEKGSNRISASRLWLAALFLGVGVEYFYSGLGQAVGLAEPDGPKFDYGSPISRYSVGIAKLAPQLSVGQQKLMLSLMQEMKDGDRA